MIKKKNSNKKGSEGLAISTLIKMILGVVVLGFVMYFFLSKSGDANSKIDENIENVLEKIEEDNTK